jgi:hypothetical protein
MIFAWGYKLEEAVSIDYWLHCTYPHMTVIDAAGLARGVFGLQRHFLNNASFLRGIEERVC